MSGNPAGLNILAGIWVPTGTAGLVLILRVYCKHVRERGMWWDDAVFIVSWILLFAANILQTIEVPLGLGRHITDVPEENRPVLMLLGETTATLSILSASWSKTAFGLTLLRVLSGWAKKAVWFIIITMNFLMVFSVILGWAQCMPTEKLWRPEVAGVCLPPSVRADYNIFSGAYAGVMDLCLAALPWSFIPSLQMKMREKFGMGLAMSMGALAGGAAFAKSAAIPALSTGDFTFYGTDLVIWGTVEVAVTIIGCSIPIFRALLSDYKKSRYLASKSVGTKPAATRLSRHNTVISHGGSASRDVVLSDSASERSILPEGEKGIIRTDEVTVEYARHDDEAGYELSSFDQAYIQRGV